MKNQYLLLALLSVPGCLPAYENNLPIAVVMDGGSGDGPDGGGGGSGKFINGYVFNVENEVKGAGPVAYINGFQQPQFTSPSADNTGKVKIEIPQAALNTSQYLIVDGSFTYKGVSAPILRTWIAPRLLLDGGSTNQDLVLHFYMNQDDLMGTRGILASELAQHGDIPSAMTFPTDFSFAYGAAVLIDTTGITQYRNYVVQVNGLSNTNCKPTMQCCVYYTHGIAEFKYANPPLPSFVDFTATNSPSHFAVVCPSSQTGDVMLTLSGNIVDLNFNPANHSFPAIMVPMVKSEGAHITWQPN
jgi:hypothetical protein